MDEPGRQDRPRPYRKTKRAEEEERTRARIVDAAETLHGSVGPARATISAIAELAGVTRPTVYRHFPDDESLFLACSRQWLARQRLPDPDGWGDDSDPVGRLREGLRDIYRYYRSGEDMLTMVLRDSEVVPDAIRGVRLENEARWQKRLLRGLPGRRRAGVTAAVAHGVAFGTWRSLAVDCRLSDHAAADLVVGMVLAAGSR